MTELEKLMQKLSPDLKREVIDYAEKLASKNKKSRPIKLKLDWIGGLKEYRDKYTSLELQKKALEWRGD